MNSRINLLNLLAAIVCTISTATGAMALMIAEHTVPNLVGALGCFIGTFGGATAAYLAWRHNL